MPGTIVALDVEDIRILDVARARRLDAMNTDPDYPRPTSSSARTGATGSRARADVTTGRGTELCVAAVEALAPHVVGRSIDGILEDLGGFCGRSSATRSSAGSGPRRGSSISPPRRS
jgi:L-fuconate dehydratase